MYKVSVCVSDLITGKNKWIQLPNEDLDDELAGFDPVDVTISDSEPVPFDVGCDVYKTNRMLQMLDSLGVDEENAISALCLAYGGVPLDDDDFYYSAENGDIGIWKVPIWPSLSTPEEKAACFLATELYEPFGDLKDSDLVLVEDKLVDFLDWDSVWEEYMVKGYSCVELGDGDVYVVEV